MRVDGVGPVPCDILLCGEGPGYFEHRDGKPFVGKTGAELTQFLDGLGLSRRDLFLTNLYRFFIDKDYRYTAEDLKRDEPALLNELREGQPTLIISMGRQSTRWFMGDVDLDSVQGIPWFINSERWGGTEQVVCFPLVHIAAGFHNSDMSNYVVSGFQQLGLYLQGKLEPRLLFDDPYPEPMYEEVTSAFQLDASLFRLKPVQPLAIDTEGWSHAPWSVQYSAEPGRGYLLRAHAHDLLDRFGALVHRLRPRLVYHSSLHDLGVLRACGLDLGTTYDDTQVMAYLLQIEPLGLKAGCLRQCNMKMDDYTDIIGDVENDLVREYLTWIWDLEEYEYTEEQQAEFTRLQAAGRRIKVLPKLSRTPLQKAVQRVLQSKRPAGLWDDQVEDLQVAAYDRQGPVPPASLDYVEPEKAIPYGCRDADGTGRLYTAYRPRLSAMGLDDVYRLELSTYPFIDRMQRIGLKPDLAHFSRLSTTLGAEIGRLQGELERATGTAGFNANSGDQVAEYLFGRLGLQEVKMTKGGRGSTNDKILEALEHEHPEHPVLSTIRQYRETYKLRHTFVDRLPDFVQRWPYDGRIHATFRTTRVVTGRLAASEPNVLAQPEHGAFAPEFKRGWVAEPGHLLLQWDESQVELRGLAHLSQDPVLLSVYRGERRNPDGTLIDLHAALAERIFGVKPKDQDKSKHRLPAKAVNFGIPMGLTSKGLSVELRKNGVDADEDTAQRWLDETLALYTGVACYMEDRKEEARRHGFVRCLSGRIRYIGGIRSRDDRVREEAERFAFSTPIQESAAFIMKQAEATIYQDILVPYWKQGRWVEPILQVHDCIKLEAEEDLAEELHGLMSKAMTQVPHGFSVPLAVEGEWGYSMGDMETF